MDDLYSFGKTKYVAADPLPRSSSRLVVNVLSVWYAVIKCTVLGILLTIKSFLFNDSKQKSSKSIQHQVALVWFFERLTLNSYIIKIPTQIILVLLIITIR